MTNRSDVRKVGAARLSPVLFDILIGHSFPEEVLSAFIDRMLKRVADALEQGAQIKRWVVEVDENENLLVWSHDCGQLLGAYPVLEVTPKGVVIGLDDETCIWTGDRFKPKNHPCSFRITPAVDPLVQEYGTEALLEQACQLPLIGALQSPDEVMGLLRQYQCQKVDAEKILDLLTQYGSDKVVRQYLIQLRDAGKIAFHRTINKGFRFGNERVVTIEIL